MLNLSTAKKCHYQVEAGFEWIVHLFFAPTGFHCPHRGGQEEQAGGGAEEQSRQIERQGAKRQRQLEQRRKEYDKTHYWITVAFTHLVHEEENWNQVDG